MWSWAGPLCSGCQEDLVLGAKVLSLRSGCILMSVTNLIIKATFSVSFNKMLKIILLWRIVWQRPWHGGRCDLWVGAMYARYPKCTQEIWGLPRFCSFVSHYRGFWMTDGARLLQSSKALVQSQLMQSNILHILQKMSIFNVNGYGFILIMSSFRKNKQKTPMLWDNFRPICWNESKQIPVIVRYGTKCSATFTLFQKDDPSILLIDVQALCCPYFLLF